jgi:hypothetical protein
MIQIIRDILHGGSYMKTFDSIEIYKGIDL